MRGDAIFLVSDAGALQRVEHQLYASEDILQDLVGKYPELLAGDQIDPDAPPRWLLLRREAAIPDSAGGEDRWWLDHLLLDQFGIPTLVEVKRSTDTRIRREVIGQMLDYVANAQAHWATGRMRDMLAQEAGSPEAGDAKMAEFLEISQSAGTSEDINRFWQTVEANLRKGDVRLLFVADELPKELRRLIEFLNEQFTNIEVLGVELRQYVGQGIKALVPRVVGQTEAARDQKDRLSPKRSSSKPPLTQEALLAECPAPASEFFAYVLSESAKRGLQISWASKWFNVRRGVNNSFFYGYAPSHFKEGVAAIELWLAKVKDPAIIAELRERATSIPSIKFSGEHTFRLFVTPETLVSAEKVFQIAVDVMSRQQER